MLNQEDLYRLNFKIIDLGGVFKRLVNFFFHHETYTCIKRNKSLLNRVSGEKAAYILALGPSLKKVDIDKIDGDTMVVNRFYKVGMQHPDFVPTYYIMVDYQFGEEKNRQDFKAALDMYLPRGTIFLLNSKLSKNPVLEGYPLDNIYFLSNFSGDVHCNGKYGLDKIMPAFQNVVGSAILALSLLGYKRINLLGCDFNSFASTERIHCYKDAPTERPLKKSWELYAYSIVAGQYDKLQQYAEKNKFIIVNGTKGSLIDSFPFAIDEQLYNNA